MKWKNGHRRNWANDRLLSLFVQAIFAYDDGLE